MASVKGRHVVIGLCVGLAVAVTLAAMGLAAYLVMGRTPILPGERVALVTVSGIITEAEPIVEQLQEHAEDPSVKAIVLRIDSPGGGVVAAQEIHEALRRLREEEPERPILVSMGEVAASGGYYIACAADKILANPGTLTGSIGVIMEFANVEELLKKVGIRTEVIKKGRHKDLGSATRPMTPEERALLEDVLEDVYEQFVEAVVEGRGLSVEQVRSLADGRIFTGRQAKELGLVDELGTLEDAIRMAAEMAGIEGKPEVVRLEPRTDFLSWLQGRLQLPRAPASVHLQYRMIGP